MHPDKWPEIKEKIKSQFEVLEEYEDFDEERQEKFEILEFKGPLGEMKAEWITRPKVLNKKTSYSNRIGGDVAVDYVYSEDEVTHTLGLYKWNEVTDEWEELSGEMFS